MSGASNDITGTLDDWSLCVALGTLFFVVGTVTGDTKGRFYDGELMTTSLLTSHPATLEEGVVAVTANSRYLLGARATSVSLQMCLYAASLRGKVIGPDGRTVEVIGSDGQVVETKVFDMPEQH